MTATSCTPQNTAAAATELVELAISGMTRSAPIEKVLNRQPGSTAGVNLASAPARLANDNR